MREQYGGQIEFKVRARKIEADWSQIELKRIGLKIKVRTSLRVKD
jgi:hypothetical protein